MSNKENHNISNNTFYGVSLPSDAIEDANQRKVFDNRFDALEVVKKYKGSRFKVFNAVEDAIHFSKEYIPIETNVTEVPKNLEKSLSPFNGLHSRELTKLRKAIERNDRHTVQQLIWSNPRFLISSGDTPVVLMEGPRYNACHIAAKEDKPEILRLILNTVSDKKFMKLLFPFDEKNITESRIDFLLDLYLNTPEKGFCETPLHFGCKFGSIGSVSVLLSFPKCDVEKHNKNDKKASEVVCERKGDNKVKSEILKLFESQLYIPLIREDFNPRIGEPFKGSPLQDFRVSGLAGPMSPTQADQLFNTLKSPRKCTPNDRRIRLTDPQKGLERIARNLCKNMNINWTEFWPFLDIQIDLASDEGLNHLEKHLRNVYYDLDSYASKGQSFFVSDCTTRNDLSDLSNNMSKMSLKSNESSNSGKDIKKFGLEEENESKHSLTSFPDLSDISGDDSFDSFDSNNSFFSAMSSPTYLFEFYVNGSKMSKDDIDAALAIQHMIGTDSCLRYDFIQNWFKRVYREAPKQFDCSTNRCSSLSSTPIKQK